MPPIFIQKILNTVNLSLDDIFDQENKIYTFLNPVSYITASSNKELFKNFDGIFADGNILVLFIRFLYRKKIMRRSFDMTSLAPQLFEYANKNNKTLYFIASKEEEINNALKIIQKKYPGLNIIEYHSGYFASHDEKNHEMQKILKLNPHFLIIGMGILKQEEFLIEIKEKGFSGIGFTCGGFIHQTSNNKIQYYPPWIDKYNLRFLYRIYKEKHTRKRYLKAAFVFPITFLMDKFQN